MSSCEDTLFIYVHSVRRAQAFITGINLTGYKKGDPKVSVLFTS